MALMEKVDTEVRDFVSNHRRMLINGEFVDAADGQTFATLDPSTEEELAQVPSGGTEDIDRAVKAARAAFEPGQPWREMSPSKRGQLVWKIGDLIEQHADELAQIESLDNGKPVAVARAADVALAADLFRYMAGWATKLEGNTLPLSDVVLGGKYHAYTLRDPVGVVGQIIPWNFPLLMAAWKLGPALTSGCTVVLKPAEQTPLSALRLGELMMEAGLPPGVVNIVTGPGDTGAALSAHMDVDKIAFTGSTEVGKMIVKAAGETNLKKLTLELGGKSPNIVYADADMDLAIPGAANGIFFNHGQACNAGSRLYVERSVFDQVIEGVADEARNIKIGPGMDEDTTMGPLIDDDQFNKVLNYMQAGLSEGAEVVVGGGRSGEQGYFVQPTILTNTSRDMSVEREEIFGPVVAAIPFDDPSDVVEPANDTAFGLAAGVFTRDISKAHRTAALLRAGTVWINCYHVFDAALPFGGYKESGWGREMGHHVLDNYLETKAVCAQL